MKHTCLPYTATLLFAFLLTAPFFAFASHILGGQITASVVSCQSYRYNIRVTFFEDVGSDVQFGNLTFYTGHGQMAALDYTEDFSRYFSDTEKLYRVAVYEMEHTFPGPGEYLMYVKEFNRSPEVVNMEAAVNTPFYAETTLRIDPFTGCNSTPVFSDTLMHTLTYTGTAFMQHINATDPEGDSLSFAFVAPRQDVDTEVKNYLLPVDYDLRYVENPTAADGISQPFMAVDGQSWRWNAPNQTGEFSVAIQVQEWRHIDEKWVAIGQLMLDRSVVVTDTTRHDPVTGIAEREDEALLGIYPNPSSGLFTLKVKDDLWQGGTATVYNIIGQLVARRAIDDEAIDFDLSGQSQGVYMVTLQQGAAQKTLRLLKR